MVAHKALCACKVKPVLSVKISDWTAFDVSKCLERIKLPTKCPTLTRSPTSPIGFCPSDLQTTYTWTLRFVRLRTFKELICEALLEITLPG